MLRHIDEKKNLMLQTNTVGQTKKNLYLATAKIEYIQPVTSWIRRKLI